MNGDGDGFQIRQQNVGHRDGGAVGGGEIVTAQILLSYKSYKIWKMLTLQGRAHMFVRGQKRTSTGLRCFGASTAHLGVRVRVSLYQACGLPTPRLNDLFPRFFHLEPVGTRATFRSPSFPSPSLLNEDSEMNLDSCKTSQNIH